MKGTLSKIDFLLTIVDMFGANIKLPLLGPVYRNVIIKSQRKYSLKVFINEIMVLQKSQNA